MFDKQNLLRGVGVILLYKIYIEYKINNENMNNKINELEKFNIALNKKFKLLRMTFDLHNIDTRRTWEIEYETTTDDEFYYDSSSEEDFQYIYKGIYTIKYET